MAGDRYFDWWAAEWRRADPGEVARREAFDRRAGRLLAGLVPLALALGAAAWWYAADPARPPAAAPGGTAGDAAYQRLQDARRRAADRALDRAAERMNERPDLFGPAPR